MKWALFIAIGMLLLWQYRRGLIATADLDTGGFWLLTLGLVKL